MNSIDQAFLKRVTDIIEEQIDNQQFDRVQLAECLFMSVSQLNRKLKALVNQSASQLILSHRLQRGAFLLKQNGATIMEIGLQVGFYDQAHFTRQFKKRYGCTPSEYRKKTTKSSR